MNKIKILSIVLLFTICSNTSFSEEQVKCNDIKKYFKKMACKSKSAKQMISSKITSSKEGINKIFKRDK